MVVCVLEVDRRTWLGLERDCEGGATGWGGIDRTGGKNKNIRAKGPASLQPECVTVQCVCVGVCARVRGETVHTPTVYRVGDPFFRTIYIRLF